MPAISAPHRKADRLQFFDESERCATGSVSAAATRTDFRRSFLRAVFEAQDDAVDDLSGKHVGIGQQSWKLMTDVADYHPACTKVLEGLLRGSSPPPLAAPSPIFPCGPALAASPGR